MLSTRGGCLFIVKTATTFQYFGILLKELFYSVLVALYPVGWRVTFAEGLGFLSATSSMWGPSTMAPLKSSNPCSAAFELVWQAGTNPLRVLMVPACWGLSHAPNHRLSNLLSSTSVACRTWLWSAHMRSSPVWWQLRITCKQVKMSDFTFHV